MKVQLITFPGCPNAPMARAALQRALASAGIVERIEEVNTADPETPEPLRAWGSPTVLLDGEDVGGMVAPTGQSCRLYEDDEGRMQSAPPESLIAAALRRAG